MLRNIKFASERLVTRELANSDAAQLFEIYSDKEAMKFRGSGTMDHLEDAYLMIENCWIEEDENAKLRLGVCNNTEKILIGTLLLVHDIQNEICEVGFSFGRKYWGNGYASETLRMIEEQLKIIENIKVLKAWCIHENIASIRVFEKAGFMLKEQNDYPKSHLFLKSIPKSS